MTKALPCPLCGGTNISSNEWTVDEDHAGQFGADEWGEIWAFECNDCLAAAPIQSWNRSPWRTDEPPLCENILLVYRKGDGTESGPIVTQRAGFSDERPVVRWMRIPSDRTVAYDAAETPARRETPDLFEDTGAVSWV